jgi:hypothetical protein
VGYYTEGTTEYEGVGEQGDKEEWRTLIETEEEGESETVMSM